MECKLDRRLLPNKVVHHKDQNPLNNNLDNLEVLNNSTHSRNHHTKYIDQEVHCVHCGNVFTLTAKQLRKRNSNKYKNKTGPYCSKHCAGYAGK